MAKKEKVQETQVIHLNPQLAGKIQNSNFLIPMNVCVCVCLYIQFCEILYFTKATFPSDNNGSGCSVSMMLKLRYTRIPKGNNQVRRRICQM